MSDSMYLDKEYAMLEILSENEEMSQRQLSKLLDISLGSVNMLINKMQREGLIKIRNITANSLAYMLTPDGIAEKANKTYRYITYHYKRINDMKEKIKKYLEKKSEIEKKVYLLLDNSEMSEIVALAVNEMGNKDNIEIFYENQLFNISGRDEPVLFVKSELREKINNGSHKYEIILEKL